MIIQKQYKFYAAHRNETLQDKCRNLHGHRYGLRCHFEVERDGDMKVSADGISIGNSVAMAPTATARTLELNMEPSQGSYWFSEARHGPAGVLVPEWVEEVLGSNGGR